MLKDEKGGAAAEKVADSSAFAFRCAEKCIRPSETMSQREVMESFGITNTDLDDVEVEIE